MFVYVPQAPSSSSDDKFIVWRARSSTRGLKSSELIAVKKSVFETTTEQFQASKFEYIQSTSFSACFRCCFYFVVKVKKRRKLDTRQQCDQRSVAETEMKLKNETEVKPQLNESTALALWNDQFTKKLRDFCSFGGLFL